jgi:hypothetical protein
MYVYNHLQLKHTNQKLKCETILELLNSWQCSKSQSLLLNCNEELDAENKQLLIISTLGGFSFTLP